MTEHEDEFDYEADERAARADDTELKLTLRHNALHTLHRAIEHLYESLIDEDYNHRSFDSASHCVEWKDKETGHLCFSIGDYTNPPAAYSLKFALLHLIQASELLLKSYVEECDPNALFRAGSRKTIGLQEALKFTMALFPGADGPYQHRSCRSLCSQVALCDGKTVRIVLDIPLVQLGLCAKSYLLKGGRSMVC